MYDTSGTQSICYAVPNDYNVPGRVTWLKAEIERAESRRLRSRAGREEALALMMSRPRTTEEAYALFGTFLGLLPPAAMFARYISYLDFSKDSTLGVVIFCFVMNLICFAVGRAMGGVLGRKLGDPRARSWPALLVFSILIGLAWGFVTGAAGGAIVFGFGAIPGVFCAVPVALAGFWVFTPLHRALSHGGMIEARQLRPLAIGVAGVIAAAILSPYLFA